MSHCVNDKCNDIYIQRVENCQNQTMDDLLLGQFHLQPNLQCDAHSQVFGDPDEEGEGAGQEGL